MFSPNHPRSTAGSATSVCPFCGKDGFKRLGYHPPQCKERNGRDYSIYLSKRTLEKKASSLRGAVRSKFCPRCHKQFQRLDTHLKRNSVCRFIPDVVPPGCSSMDKSDYDTSQQSTPNNMRDDDHQLPGFLQQSPSYVPTACDPPDAIPHQHQAFSPLAAAIMSITPHVLRNAALPPSPEPRSHLKLPTKDEEWRAADQYLAAVVVPQVIAEVSVEDKNLTLTQGIYDYFSSQFGVQQSLSHKRRSQASSVQEKLKNLKECKNEARWKLQQARRSHDHSPDQIKSIAINFFNLVRSYSKLKQMSVKLEERQARNSMRAQCHHHFWRFTKQLLDEKSSDMCEPAFSEAQATQFFSEVYHSEPHQFSKPAWMPSAKPPTVSFDCGEISLDEVMKAVKELFIPITI